MDTGSILMQWAGGLMPSSRRYSTCTVRSDGRVVPWLAASGPLSYTPESPPPSDYYFQYSWIIPDIFDPDTNKRRRFYFGAQFKEHAKDTEAWVNEGLDILGPALISLTGWGDRLRMHCLLAYVNVRATKTGVSFNWEGAWEYDPMSGTGNVKLGKDGRLRGRIKIQDGDESAFTAVRAEEPDEPIPNPPSYRDKWRRR